MKKSEIKAQGAIEYLLIIGAAILIVAVMVIALVGITSTGTQTASGESAETTLDPLKELVNQSQTLTPTNCFDNIQNPIPICTLSDLNKMREDLTKNYELQENIDATETLTWNMGAGWEPIGNSSTQFTGNFNGNGHTISNLYIYRPATSYTGLFGATNLSELTTIKLIDFNIQGRDYTGGLVGNGFDTNISHIYFEGTVAGANFVGGIAGGTKANIINSHSAGSVSGGVYIGGLMGESNYPGKFIENSYSTSSVNATTFGGGGLTGNLSGPQIRNSFSTGPIMSVINAGGITGYVSGGTITNSYWYDNVGDNATNCYNEDNTGCTKIVDANGGISWFYLDTNGPLTSWDFTNTWREVSGSYPVLAWQD